MEPVNEPTINSQTIQSNQPKKGRKPLAVIVVIVLIFAGLVASLAYFNSRETNKSSTSTNSILNETANVSIEASGFVPQTMHVKKDTTVTWTNKDVDSHMVVSGPYPANSQLPELNSEDPLKNAESYSYVFEKVGTYNYHDNTGSASFQGVVIVE